MEVAFLSGSVGGSCRTGYAEFKQLLNSDFQRGEVHDRDVSKRRESRDCGMWGPAEKLNKIFKPVPGQGVRSLVPGARNMKRFIRGVKMGKEKEQRM